LYFSRSSAVVPGDLYVSPRNGRMSFGAATPITELNDAGANDIQPNVRKDGREIVFSSNRGGGLGGQDIWSATRASVDDPWANLVNLARTSTQTSASRGPHSRGTRSSFSSAEPAQRERARVEPACPTST
jgi:Tol biopolymer transport system component